MAAKLGEQLRVQAAQRRVQTDVQPGGVREHARPVQPPADRRTLPPVDTDGAQLGQRHPEVPVLVTDTVGDGLPAAGRFKRAAAKQ